MSQRVPRRTIHIRGAHCDASSQTMQTAMFHAARYTGKQVRMRGRRGLAAVAAAAAEPSASSSSSMMGMGMGRTRAPRAEGDIGSVFASLSGEGAYVFPERFKDLKQMLMGDASNQERLRHSWTSLTQRLAQLAPEIERRKQDCIPQTTYEDFVKSPSAELLDRIKQSGTVIIRNTVSEDQALRWLQEIGDYIKLNPEVKGFPADDKQVFELYWSKPQLAARAHPRSMAVQRSLLRLFAASPSAPVSLLTPLIYADRLRIRNPGDAKFALGPHVDGGSIERWEDPNYRAVYSKILEGRWEEFDAWQIESRALANQDLYHGAGSCGVFRAFQGWTSLSKTGPGEGTLRVYPYIREMSAYTLLRPFFRAKQSSSTLGREAYLAADNWVLDTESPDFPNAPPGRSQEYNDETHPHLELDRTMVSIPEVRPGDQAWWHADTIHAVEANHRGDGPSAVLYIPSVPLTAGNVDYVRDQRESFLKAIPPPDFPGGVGESGFRGTGRDSDIADSSARNAMGLAPFALEKDLTAGERAVRQEANRILGF